MNVWHKSNSIFFSSSVQSLCITDVVSWCLAGGGWKKEVAIVFLRTKSVRVASICLVHSRFFLLCGFSGWPTISEVSTSSQGGTFCTHDTVRPLLGWIFWQKLLNDFFSFSLKGFNFVSGWCWRIRSQIWVVPFNHPDIHGSFCQPNNAILITFLLSHIS